VRVCASGGREQGAQQVSLGTGAAGGPAAVFMWCTVAPVTSSSQASWQARGVSLVTVDGSGMLQEGSGGVISGVGDVFTMHNDELGDYG
jgi:hypothetical protein